MYYGPYTQVPRTFCNMSFPPIDNGCKELPEPTDDIWVQFGDSLNDTQTRGSFICREDSVTLPRESVAVEGFSKLTAFKEGDARIELARIIRMGPSKKRIISKKLVQQKDALISKSTSYFSKKIKQLELR